MKIENEGPSLSEVQRTQSDGAQLRNPHLDVRLRNRRTAMVAMLVLLMFLSASIWLGCVSSPPPPAPPADPSQCSNGIAVADPVENPGLVEDCETLLGLRDALAGKGGLFWSAQTPIQEWNGISVDSAGQDRRVTGVSLPEPKWYLRGVIPPELNKLTFLRELNLASNSLNGEVPAELGYLVELEELILTNNSLTGNIPHELGGLTNLRVLELAGNRLTGSIPLQSWAISPT